MKLTRGQKKGFIAFLIVVAFGLFYFAGGKEYLNFTYLKENLNDLLLVFEARPVAVVTVFCGIYLLLTALSLPGSIILTILAGALFGSLSGALIVTFLGTMGATISFILSRYLFKDYLNVKFRRQFIAINRNLKKDGLIYLLGVRLIPISPFVIVNLVLGLTEIKIWTFFWTTFIGMLPGNLIYVYAGTKIKEIESISQIMTPQFLLSLTALGCIPFLVKKIISVRRNKELHA